MLLLLFDLFPGFVIRAGPGLALPFREVSRPFLERAGCGVKTMKSLEEIRKIIQERRDLLARRYGVAVVGVFGSYVRGKESPGSDLDLLAEILRPISLLDLVGAELYLEEALGVKVDLVPKRSLRKELRDSILKEAVAP